jgi:NAD(P)-dependent dehydrogenase (short-subunit alcohol dehydrogenase family)
MTLTVVSGATGDLGRAIVARLVAEEHEVLAVARDPDGLASLAASSPRISAVAADLGMDEAATTIAAAVGKRTVRMAIHCAAARVGGGVLDVATSDVLTAVDIKVNGLLRLVRAVQPSLIEGSRIVAIGGNLGFDPIPDAATAGIGSAAQANAVRQLNRALAPAGVTCHTVAPGPVATERWFAIAATEAQRRGVDEAVVRSEAAASSPLGRLTTPEEVAWIVARLADPEAAALAGSTLLVDTGRRTSLP